MSDPIQPDFGPKVIFVPESEIKEDRVFSKEEIFSIIHDIAVKEGFQGDLRIIEERYGPNDTLIGLVVEAPLPEYMKMEGHTSARYHYVIKGSHGVVGNPDYSGGIVTIIARSYDQESDKNIEAGIVAEYTDGTWDLRPGEILPKITGVEIVNPEEEK